MSLQRTITRQTRRLMLGFLRIIAGRTPREPLRPEQVRRVLLIRYDRIGDAVITTPLLSALKHLAPWAEIDVLASPANSSIFQHDNRVSQVFVWDGSPLDRLRVMLACCRRNHDVAYQLILARTTLPAILTSLLAPRALTVGKSMPGHEALFNHAVDIPEVHFSDRTLLLIGGGIRITTPLPDFPYSLDVPLESRVRARQVIRDAGLGDQEFILVNISAGTERRELSDEQNIILARGLSGLGFPVAVTGSPEAAERLARIAGATGAHALRFGSILDAAAGIEGSCLVITPDTGTLHIAGAMGVAVVGMFALRGHPEGWAPRDVPFRVVRASSGEVLSEIDVNQVITEAASLLAELRLHGPQPEK